MIVLDYEDRAAQARRANSPWAKPAIGLAVLVIASAFVAERIEHSHNGMAVWTILIAGCVYVTARIFQHQAFGATCAQMFIAANASLVTGMFVLVPIFCDIRIIRWRYWKFDWTFAFLNVEPLNLIFFALPLTWFTIAWIYGRAVRARAICPDATATP